MPTTKRAVMRGVGPELVFFLLPAFLAAAYWLVSFGA
jgi:hypothetical protein